MALRRRPFVQSTGGASVRSGASGPQASHIVGISVGPPREGMRIGRHIRGISLTIYAPYQYHHIYSLHQTCRPTSSSLFASLLPPRPSLSPSLRLRHNAEASIPSVAAQVAKPACT
jgi:hypothetical protein